MSTVAERVAGELLTAFSTMERACSDLWIVIVTFVTFFFFFSYSSAVRTSWGRAFQHFSTSSLHHFSTSALPNPRPYSTHGQSGFAWTTSHVMDGFWRRFSYSPSSINGTVFKTNNTKSLIMLTARVCYIVEVTSRSRRRHLFFFRDENRADAVILQHLFVDYYNKYCGCSCSSSSLDVMVKSVIITEDETRFFTRGQNSCGRTCFRE